MLQTLESQRASDVDCSFPAQYLKAFRFMVRSRVLDFKMAALYRAGKIHGGVFLGRGQEALSASLGMALRKGDIFAPLIRDGAGRLAFGEPVIDAVRTYLGSALGPMRGRDGNVHRGRPREGLLPMISHLGAMISVVNGTLMVRKFKNIKGTVGAACIGDGGTSTGAFHEALNQAAVERLPLVLVVANNQFAYSTPTNRQFACDDLADKAVGYGVVAHSVDATNLEDCLRVLSTAVSEAREGGGPQLVVGNLLRLCGHGEHDDAHYIDAELKKSPLGRDCLKVAGERLLREHWGDGKVIRAIQREAIQEVTEAIAKVQREPGPDPYAENWCALASRHLSELFETPAPVRPPST
ncbi:MAG TPA: thiamine pyrophosphate-dependent dehydrogenase E1 component subunit alpha [Verrucomicrobiae bacterium]|jgi:pyruvate dehydrogenase E1 component alpha subunit/2-oxoisovalerate dehydrogenase E1 component alpha subunit|nr:thiamine pyrophosphate-dependent dehydrogenase E1 component subunit alpha [Verrucomicrobiae bacterium]